MRKKIIASLLAAVTVGSVLAMPANALTVESADGGTIAVSQEEARGFTFDYHTWKTYEYENHVKISGTVKSQAYISNQPSEPNVGSWVWAFFWGPFWGKFGDSNRRYSAGTGPAVSSTGFIYMKDLSNTTVDCERGVTGY